MALTPYDDMLENMLDDEQAPAKPKAPPDPLAERYGAILDNRSQSQQTQLRGSMIEAGKTPAEEAVEAQKLGTALGIPPGVVLRDLPTFRANAKLKGIKYEDMLASTPTLAKTLTNDPAFAAAVQDDLEPLGFLEWLGTAPKRALAQKQAQNEAAALRTASLFRSLTPAELEQLEGAKKRAKEGGQLGAAQSWFRGAIVGGTQLLPDLWGSFLEGARQAPAFGVAGATAMGVLGQMGPQVLTPEEVITMPGGFAAGLGAGMLAGGAKYTFGLEAGNAYDEFLDWKDETGRPMDRDVAKAAALAVGFINGALEVPGLTNFAKVIPGFKQLKGALTVNAMKAALKSSTMRAALGDVIKTYGKTLTFETAQEVAQRATNIVAGELGKTAANLRGADFAHKTVGEAIDELGDEAAGSFQSFALMPALGSAVDLYSARAKAKRAGDNVRFFSALGAGAKQSKTIERLPQAAQALIAEATKDGGIENLYVPISSWDQYWQSQDIDPRDMATTVAGDREAYDRAVQTRTDLKIPLANYTARLAGTDHNKYFAHELRFRADEMNAREALQYREQQTARAAAEKGVALPTPERNIEADVYAKLVEGGKFSPDAARKQAQLVSGIGNIGARAGVDPFGLFSRLGLTVGRELAGKAPQGPGATAEAEGPPPVVPGAGGEGSAAPSAEGLPGLLTPLDGETPPGGPIPPAQVAAGGAQAGEVESAGAWMGRLTAGRQAKQAAIVERFSAVGLVSSRNGNVQHVIHPSASEPGRLQVTSFVDGEPIGHLVVNTIEDAAREVAADTLDPLQGAIDEGAQTGEGEGAEGGGAVPAAGAGVPGRAWQRGTAGAGGQDAGRSGGAGAATGGVGAIPETYREYFTDLVEPARGLGYTGTDDQLAAIYLERLEAAKLAAEDYQEILSEQKDNPSDLLRAIVAAGGLGIEAEGGTSEYSKRKKGKLLARGGMVGELETMLEGLERPRVNKKTGKPMPRQFLRHGYLPGAKRTAQGPFVIRRKGGLTIDGMLEALQQDPIWEGRWDGIEDFIEEVDHAIRVETGSAKRVVATSDVWQALRSYYRVRDDYTWWLDTQTAERSVDDEAVEDLLDASGLTEESLSGEVAGEVSFDPAEFEQGLFDDPGDGVDRLTTGELQPRLPGAEHVRDQEVQQPQLGDVGFSLEGQADQRSAVQETLFGAPVPPAKPTKAKERQVPEGQQDLFQEAWHGSPHIFEKFALHAIGTGEGAQAYGWGLYFASRREVADEYRARLAGQQRQTPNLLIDDMDPYAFSVLGTLTNEQRDGLNEVSSRLWWHWQKPDPLGVIKGELERSIENAEQDRADFASRGKPLPMLREMQDEGHRHALEFLNAFGDRLAVEPPDRPGRTYKVEVPENDVLLDWDKPISEQPPAVRAALERLGVDEPQPDREQWEHYEITTDADLAFAPGSSVGEWIIVTRDSNGKPDAWSGTLFHDRGRAARAASDRNSLQEGWGPRNKGRDMYAAIAAQVPRSPNGYGMAVGPAPDYYTPRNAEEFASRALAAEGVKGIRYLDGFSRRQGEGSHNFVIFDDNLIEITEFDQSQEAELTPEALEAWAQETKEKAGADLVLLNVRLTNAGDIYLETIAVKRGANRAGLGSRVMTSLSKFADQHGARIVLTPSGAGFNLTITKPGERQVHTAETESPKALEKWYARFGFVKNAGRRIDLSLSQGMYREPTEKLGAKEKPKKAQGPSAEAKRATAFAKWFGESKVVDEQGRPKVMYHATESDFDTFKRTEDIGFHFGTVGQANDVATRTGSVGEPVNEGANIIPVYLKIENPLRLDDLHMWESDDLIRELHERGVLNDADIDELDQMESHEVDREYVARKLEAKGYDGIVYKNQSEGERLSDVPDDVRPRLYGGRVELWSESTGLLGTGKTRAAADKATRDMVRKGYVKRREDSYIVFHPEQIKSAIGNVGTFDPRNPSILHQDDKQKTKRRGVIRIGQGGIVKGSAARQISIALFEQADPSTFLHETGHLFLEVMHEVTAAIELQADENKTEAQKKLLADRDALLAWFGVQSWDQVTKDHHEQFAQGFEKYLAEGRAPSLELRSAFASFRAWLLGVYKSIKAMRVNLTPEVRRVMDRMLASDNAIAEAEQASNLRAMFSTPESMGYTPEEFAPYRQAVEDASRTAQETLELQLLAEVQREKTSQWRERRDEIRAQVEKDVHQRSVYQALAAMQYGEKPDGSPLNEGFTTEPIKLSRKLLVERYGAERLKRLPRPYIYTVDGGADPDVVASLFGFEGGDELLLEVENAGPMKAVIEHETDQRMLAEHGSILLDGSLYERATAALGNKDREKVVRMELRALAQLRRVAEPFILAGDRALAEEKRERAYERRWFEAETKLKIAMAEGRKQVEIDELEAEVKNLRQKARGGPSAIRAALPPADIVEGLAADRVAAMRLHDLQPSIYWSAARQASQAATEAAARQDFDAAIRHKQQELLSLAMFRAVSAAREDIDRRVKKAKDYTKGSVRQRIGQAGGSYLEQIDGVLERYEFKPTTKKERAQRADIRAWVAALEAQGLPSDLPESVLNEARRVPFQELPYSELVDVTDGLDMIAHLARLSRGMLQQARREALAEIEDELATSIRLHKEKKEQRTTRDRSGPAERWRTVGQFFASHIKHANRAREFDGFKDGGPAWEYLVRPFNTAADKEAVMNHAAAKALGALVDKAFPGLKKRKLFERTKTAEVGKSLSRMERIMYALNWGNEGNRQRVRAYEKWSDDQVAAVLAPLTRSDWEFVQGVWDLIDGFWPEIEAKQKRVTGIAPTKVERVTVHTEHGDFAGGYFPLNYDDRLDATVASQLESEAGNIQKLAAYVQASTKRNHTMERAAAVSKPIRLDFGVITGHISTVIHDLAYHEALVDVGRVLASKGVRDAIFERYGDIVYKQMKTALKDIAIGERVARRDYEPIIDYIRHGATVAGLAWSFQTVALQPVGLTQSMVRIGPQWVARGVGRWLRGAVVMEHVVEGIYEKSPFMRMRANTFQREINEIRNHIGIETGKLAAWVDAGLRFPTMDKLSRQAIADSYFWMIQKAQQVVDVPTWLGAYEKAIASGAEEDRAIALADQAVVDSQGSGQIKDLAEIQKGSAAFKMWTNFYSFFSTTANLTVEVTKRTKWTNPVSVGRAAVDYMLLYIIPASLGVLIHEALKGRGDDEPEDTEGLAEKLVRGNAAYLLSTMVGFRELAPIVEGFNGWNGPAGARAFNAITRFAVQAKSGEFDEAFWRALNDSAGVIFHYPSAQVWRTLSGIVALDAGKTENPMAVIGGAK